MPYARGTTVGVDKSRAEIERMLTRRGARKFYSGYDENRAIVAFELGDRNIKFELALPSPGDRPSAKNEQLIRERWRALALAIKSRLICVEAGIETVEEAFLAQVVMPNRETVYEHLRGYLSQEYGNGNMPPLLPGRVG